MSFSAETIERLKKPLDASLVKTRDGGRGVQLSYIEGYAVIRLANEIFGFEGWDTSIDKISDIRTPGGKTLYYATVTVAVGGTAKSDVGCGVAASDAADSHDTAIKAAVTDAMKRAFRQFGDQFGNGLYDKEANQAASSVRRAATATAAKPKAVEQTPPIPCEEPGCPNKLTGYASSKPGGASYNSVQQAEQSKARFGKALCVDHMRALQKPPVEAGG